MNIKKDEFSEWFSRIKISKIAYSKTTLVSNLNSRSFFHSLTRFPQFSASLVFCKPILFKIQPKNCKKITPA